MSDNRLRYSVAPGIAKDQRLNELVSAAHRELGGMVGRTRTEVNEDWSLDNDAHGRPLVLLNLSDYTGRVQARFAPEELANTSQVRYRLIRAWGDLLQNRSHRLLDDLMGPEE